MEYKMMNTNYFEELYKKYAETILISDYLYFENKKNEYIQFVMRQLNLTNYKCTIIEMKPQTSWEKIIVKREEDQKQFFLKLYKKKLEVGPSNSKYDELKEEFFKDKFNEFAISKTYANELQIKYLPLKFAKCEFKNSEFVFAGIIFEYFKDFSQLDSISTGDSFTYMKDIISYLKLLEEKNMVYNYYNKTDACAIIKTKNSHNIWLNNFQNAMHVNIPNFHNKKKFLSGFENREMPPEIFRMKNSKSTFIKELNPFKCQIYSFAIYFLQALNIYNKIIIFKQSGATDFEKHKDCPMTHFYLMENIQKYRMNLKPDDLPLKKVLIILEQCLQYDPRDRPTASDVYQFIQNMNNPFIEENEIKEELNKIIKEKYSKENKLIVLEQSIEQLSETFKKIFQILNITDILEFNVKQNMNFQEILDYVINIVPNLNLCLNQLKEFMNSYENITNELKLNKDLLKQKDESYGKLAKDYKLSKEEYDKGKIELLNKENEIKSLKDQLDKKLQQGLHNQDIEAKIQSANMKNNELEKTNRSLENDLKSSKQRIDDLILMAKEDKSTKENLRINLGNEEKKFRDLSKLHADCENQIKNLTSKLNIYQKEISDSANNYKLNLNKLLLENEKSSKQIEELNLANQKYIMEIQNLEKKCNEITENTNYKLSKWQENTQKDLDEQFDSYKSKISTLSIAQEKDEVIKKNLENENRKSEIAVQYLTGLNSIYKNAFKNLSNNFEYPSNENSNNFDQYNLIIQIFKKEKENMLKQIQQLQEKNCKNIKEDEKAGPEIENIMEDSVKQHANSAFVGQRSSDSQQMNSQLNFRTQNINSQEINKTHLLGEKATSNAMERKEFNNEVKKILGYGTFDNPNENANPITKHNDSSNLPPVKVETSIKKSLGDNNLVPMHEINTKDLIQEFMNHINLIYLKYENLNMHFLKLEESKNQSVLQNIKNPVPQKTLIQSPMEYFRKINLQIIEILKKSVSLQLSVCDENLNSEKILVNPCFIEFNNVNQKSKYELQLQNLTSHIKKIEETFQSLFIFFGIIEIKSNNQNVIPQPEAKVQKFEPYFVTEEYFSDASDPNHLKTNNNLHDNEMLKEKGEINNKNEIENEIEIEKNIQKSFDVKHIEDKPKAISENLNLHTSHNSMGIMPSGKMLNLLKVFQGKILVPEKLDNLDLVLSKLDNLMNYMTSNSKIKEFLINDISNFFMKVLTMLKDLIKENTDANTNELFNFLLKFSSFNIDTFCHDKSKIDTSLLKFGIFLKGEKNLYIGDLLEKTLDPIFQGFGIILFNVTQFDGNCYIGNWLNGKMNGAGIYYKNFKEFYCGEWNEDCMKGYGSYAWNINGKKINYEGQWDNNLMHGYGKLFIENSLIYEGQWCEGKKHGLGYQKLPGSENFFVGNWKNDSKDIRGTIYSVESDRINIIKSLDVEKPKPFHSNSSE